MAFVCIACSTGESRTCYLGRRDLNDDQPYVRLKFGKGEVYAVCFDLRQTR